MAESFHLEDIAARLRPERFVSAEELHAQQHSEETGTLKEGIQALREGMQRNERIMDEFVRMRRQDDQVLKEMEALRKQDTELRVQNTHLRRQLLRRPDSDEEAEKAVEDIVDEDPAVGGKTITVFGYILSFRVLLTVIIGCSSVLVLCIIFWLVEVFYWKHFDENGDGEVEMEEVLIQMQNAMTVSYTTMRATGVCVGVGTLVGSMLWWAGIIQMMITQLLVYLFLAVGLACCLGIFVYHIYLNISSMLGALFKELKDMIQGVINFLEEKAEAAAEELEKLTGSMGFLAQDSAGMYVIKSRCDLQKTIKLDSQVLQKFEENTLVNLLKVKIRLADGRIRGLVEAPRGWISIQDMETGFRWAEKKEYRRGYFKVIVDSIPVTSDVEINSPPSYKPFVKKGQVVRVREVRHRLREGAVRGNIADGWITLLDTTKGKHNVESWTARAQEGIIPSFASIAGSALVPSSSDSAHEDPSMLEGDVAASMHDVQVDPFLTQARPASARGVGSAATVPADAGEEEDGG